MSDYQVTDTLFLWYLGDPGRPVPVGELSLVLTSRGVSLRYGAQWLAHGFALSEDLPLTDREHLPRERETAAGAVDDARPDRWGERVIRLLDRPPRLSVLEMLYFAGDERFGALGVSSSPGSYLPREPGVLPGLGDVGALHELIQRVMAGDRIEPRHRRLLAPGTTLGGARPKALVEIDGEPWVIKFAESGWPSEPLVEHAAMTLAAMAGITVAQTRSVPLPDGHAVAVRRFDRGEGRRQHALSANVALKAAGSDLSYPALAQLLRRRGPARADQARQQMAEVFRRLVFNILIDNADDHEKNHALLMDDAQHYLLSPAFDVLPTGQALGYQMMGVGREGAASTLDNALSMASAYGLSLAQAREELRGIAKAVDGWPAHFAAHGVDGRTIDSLSEQIDRPFLREQRRAALR